MGVCLGEWSNFSGQPVKLSSSHYLLIALQSAKHCGIIISTPSLYIGCQRLGIQSKISILTDFLWFFLFCPGKCWDSSLGHNHIHILVSCLILYPVMLILCAVICAADKVSLNVVRILKAVVRNNSIYVSV
jgi:hypothetical protein